MRDVLHSEDYLSPKLMHLLYLENVAEVFKWLPSQVEKEDCATIEAMLYIYSLKNQGGS
jgi:hypothetical protein